MLETIYHFSLTHSGQWLASILILFYFASLIIGWFLFGRKSLPYYFGGATATATLENRKELTPLPRPSCWLRAEYHDANRHSYIKEYTTKLPKLIAHTAHHPNFEILYRRSAPQQSVPLMEARFYRLIFLSELLLNPILYLFIYWLVASYV